MEAPALARLQSEYQDQGLTVIAVNIWPSNYSLDEWVGFWKRIGAGDVLWAQDANDTAIRAYKVMALGTEVIVDREGAIVFRSEGAAGYKELRSELEKVL